MDLLGVDVVSRGSADFQSEELRAAVASGSLSQSVDLIVRPTGDSDISSALIYAQRHRLTTVLRPGSSPIAPTGRQVMVLDLSGMNGLAVDVDEMVATVEPAVSGSELNHLLNAYGFMYPGPHLPPVAVGGYLLRGGIAQDSGLWRNSAGTVRGVDAVTPEGSYHLAQPSPRQLEDLLCAGSNTIVSRYYLKVEPLPPTAVTLARHYGLTAVPELTRWLARSLLRLPPQMEISMIIGPNLYGFEGSSALLFGDALGWDALQAHDALEIFQQAPAHGLVSPAGTPTHTTLEVLLDRYETILGAARPFDAHPHFRTINGDELPGIAPSDLAPGDLAPGRHMHAVWWRSRRSGKAQLGLST